MIKNLGIVGNGRIGSALGDVFSVNGWKVNYFDNNEDACSVKSLGELGDVSDVIIIAAPSWVNREIAVKLRSHVSGKLVVTVAKGVEPKFINMAEVLKEVADGHFDHGVMYGPMLASEISEKKPAAVLFATSAHKWANSFKCSSRLQIVYNDDPYSTALCGVLKNIFAITLGINDGLKLGHNSKGALAVGIMDEFQRLLAELGGQPEQAFGLAGLGDLLATGWSDMSFNHRMGKMIAIDAKSNQPKGEGVAALKEIKTKVDLKNYPLLNTTYRVVFEDANPLLIAQNLLRPTE